MATLPVDSEVGPVRLRRVVRDRARVRVQGPLGLSEDSEPQPDLALLPLGDYRHEHPTTALVIIEVADSSLPYDRVKGHVYARAGIPEYWIVDLVDRVVEVHTDPRDGAYASTRTVDERGTVSPAAFPDVAIPVASLLP